MLSMDAMQQGNMHALKHYEESGKKFPLVVKLGRFVEIRSCGV